MHWIITFIWWFTVGPARVRLVVYCSSYACLGSWIGVCSGFTGVVVKWVSFFDRVLLSGFQIVVGALLSGYVGLLASFGGLWLVQCMFVWWFRVLLVRVRAV